jgi:plasmid stabilization system protein ParE
MPAPYTLALTPGALADLDRLDQFLRQRNPAAADRMLTAIINALTRLTSHPLSGRPLPASPLRALIVRFGKGGYVCLYEVRDHMVLVARVFHAREDRSGGGDLT